MKVLKFGGSSMGTPEKIKHVKEIIESQKDNCVIIVSAFEGITDSLVEISKLAKSKDISYKKKLDAIIEFHNHIATDSNIPPSDQLECEKNALLEKLENTLEGVYLLGDLSPRISDYILSFGERLAALIMREVIKGAVLLDSRKFIKTDSTYGRARIDIGKTYELVKENINIKEHLTIVPGFIAQSKEGNTVTLGRGGSDYTAAVIASSLDADCLEIWTDVDGFMTADPKKVEKAIAIERLTYAEAMELSHFGAEVIYTPTIKPVLKKNIPILIKNTFKPDLTGTTISAYDDTSSVNKIKGISSIDDIDLITLHGAGLVGVSGISMRLFGALAKHNINIILITQASSEYSISFAVDPDKSDDALMAINEEFESEIEFRKEISYRIEKNLSSIAIVGERMKNTPGISASLFQSLGRNGINIVAIAQGSSELNISVVIKNESLKKALNVIHEGFFLSHIKELHLYLIGIGTVGSSLIKQIKEQQPGLLDEHHLKINVVGLARSKKMIIDENGIELESCLERLEKDGIPTDLQGFIEKISSLNLRNSVFVDCTADKTVADLYEGVLNKFSSVVTANKIACSSNFGTYKRLKMLAKEKSVKMFYETNVGAGLPILSTIGDLIKSGDKVVKLEAVLSGTLNFIFNILSKEIKLSEAIKMAKDKGFSEPDPRIDLSGVDVVRKLLILARESGWPLEQNDVIIHKFLPDECFEGSIEDFWEKVKAFDDDFETKRKQLQDENKKWRFVANYEKGQASVALREVDINHPAFNLEGSNNIILITTERYNEEPMVIKGYGAGAEVTAAGVFADIIRVANV